MQASNIPAKFQIPWANSAISPYIGTIPVASQQGITSGAASFTDGFPPVTFLPLGAGGTAPYGKDYNGIFQIITKWKQWNQAGAPIAWDSTFSGEIGGYPAGALVQSATTSGLFWFSTADNNTTNPDTGGAGWTAFSFFGSQTRVITAGGSFTTNLNDGTVGLLRSTSLGISSTTLPVPAANKEYWFEDLNGGSVGFSAYPLTVSAPAGHNIAGASSVTFNVAKQCGRVKYYGLIGGVGTWSVKF